MLSLYETNAFIGDKYRCEIRSCSNNKVMYYFFLRNRSDQYKLMKPIQNMPEVSEYI